jgi:integrase
MTDRWRGLSRSTVEELLPFALARLHSADQPSVARVQNELPGLRWLLRRSMERGGPQTLMGLAFQPDLVAAVFRAPANKDRAESSTYLHAFRTFLYVTLPVDEARAAFAAVELQLIPQRGAWYAAERRAGGRPVTQRSTHLLLVEDLLSIIVRAGQSKRGEHALRDEVIAALWCFSPLRPGEIVALDWERLSFHEVADDMPFGAWTRVVRHDRTWDLPIHMEASKRVVSLRAVTQQATKGEPAGGRNSHFASSLRAAELQRDQRHCGFRVGPNRTRPAPSRVPRGVWIPPDQEVWVHGS